MIHHCYDSSLLRKKISHDVCLLVGAWEARLDTIVSVLAPLSSPSLFPICHHGHRTLVLSIWSNLPTTAQPPPMYCIQKPIGMCLFSYISGQSSASLATLLLFCSTDACSPSWMKHGSGRLSLTWAMYVQHDCRLVPDWLCGLSISAEPLAHLLMARVSHICMHLFVYRDPSN